MATDEPVPRQTGRRFRSLGTEPLHRPDLRLYPRRSAKVRDRQACCLLSSRVRWSAGGAGTAPTDAPEQLRLTAGGRPLPAILIPRIHGGEVGNRREEAQRHGPQSIGYRRETRIEDACLREGQSAAWGTH